MELKSKKYEIEKSFFNKYRLLGFPSSRNSKKLTYETKNKNGEIIKKEYIDKNTDKL